MVKTMKECCPDKVDELIQNNANFSDEDKDTLLGLTEEGFAMVINKSVDLNTDTTEETPAQTKEELLANERDLEQIREFLEVDSVGYISLEGMLSCAVLPPDHYCTACWSGKYPIPVDVAVNKFTMERYQMNMFDEVEGN